MLVALTWISITLAVVIVVVLAVTLIATAYQLMKAAQAADALAGGLEVVGAQTEKLPEYITTINGALVQLRGGLRSVDGHFAGLAHEAGLE